MSEQYKKLEELSKDYLSKIYKDKTVIRVQTGTKQGWQLNTKKDSFDSKLQEKSD